MFIVRVGDTRSVQLVGDLILALIGGGSLSDPNLTSENSSNKSCDYRLIQSNSYGHPERTILVCCGGNSTSQSNNTQNPILLHVKDITLSSSIAVKLGATVLHSLKSTRLGGELCHIRIDSQRVANINSVTVLPWCLEILLIQEYASTHSNLGDVQESLELSLVLEWNRIHCLDESEANLREPSSRRSAEDGDSKDNSSLLTTPAEVHSPISLTSSPPVDLPTQTSTGDEIRLPQKVSIGKAITESAATQEAILKSDIQKQEVNENNKSASSPESYRPNLKGQTATKTDRWLPPSGKSIC